MRCLLPVSLIAFFPHAATGQETPSLPLAAPPAETAAGDEIVVVASRLAGQVDTDLPPVLTLDEADIAAYGATTIGDLLDAVSPQTGSGRGRGEGRPVILLNGQRIASFRQLRDIPPEAIRRMEVLPEEVALRFGYPPDQRVVNFILKDDFSAVQVAGEYNVPARGGFAESELEAGLARFDGPRRLNLNWKTTDQSLLTEAERGILPSPQEQRTISSDPDPLAFRSLVDDSTSHALTGTWSTGLGKDGLGGNVTIDGELRRGDSRALLGLDTVTLTSPDGASALRTLPGALSRNVRSDAVEAGLTLNRPWGNWRLSATADSAYAVTTTRTDRSAALSALVDAASAGALAIDGALPLPAEAGRDRARKKLLTVSVFAGLSGSPMRLPAGPVSMTVDAGYDRLENRASDIRLAGGATRLKRGIAKAGGNLALPITGGRENFADALGDISLNFSGDIHRFSDFGWLTDWSAGLVWSPTPALTVNVSYIFSQVAPSVGQLADPLIETANVPVYDFATGETALVSVITGGNPDLLAETRRDIKLSANHQLDLFDRSSLVVEYFRNGSDDVTRGFPLLAPAVEAAFPGRVTRDGAGRLLAVDRRPVTFDRVETETMRWGVNLSGRLGEGDGADSGGGAGGRRGRPRSEGGGPGLMPFGRGGPPGGRWNLAVYDTWRFADTVRIAAASPLLDQLGGQSLTAGGVPRHAIAMEGGVFRKGLGLRLNANWTAPARVLGSGGPGVADLRFGSVLDIGARAFVNFDNLPGATGSAPWLKGLRLAFEFDNVLDSRQRVTDGGGGIPFAYQRAFRDPRGRFAGVDLSKSF